MSIDVFLDGVPQRRRAAALFEQLRQGIVDGRIGGGDRLPTSRDLAAELGLARSTVTTVYSRLIAEGFADGRTGDGTFAAEHTTPSARRPATRADSRTSADLPVVPVLLEPPAGGWRVDLRSGRPDPALFPLQDWRRCVTGALQRPPPGYGDPAGLPEFRRALAASTTRSRGVVATADQIIVTAGAQGAFDLCGRALARPGDIVAVENPGYAPARRAFENHGLRVAPVPVDKHGIVIDAIPRSARLIYVTPSHQAPTGVVMSAQRRRALLDHARVRDALVIEDDYDTEYRYIDRPLEPLHRLDTTGRVIYVGSFSKTLSPSLRIGYLVATADTVAALTAARALVDTQPPHLTQAALAELVISGKYERHLRRLRRIYLHRRDIVLETLDDLHRREWLAAKATCAAGLHTTIELASGVDAAAIAVDLQRQGIAIETTDDSWVGEHPPGLVIGFGLADPAGLLLALHTVEASIAGACR